MTAEQQPRSQQREGWPVALHLRQHDNDIDTLEAGLNRMADRVAEELAKNRATMWKVLGIIMAALGVALTVIGLLTKGA